MEHDDLTTLWRYYTVIRPYMVSQVRPHVLTAAAERSAEAGRFLQRVRNGLPGNGRRPRGIVHDGIGADEKGRQSNEDPQHPVTIAKPFAVSKYELTFADWDACAAYGDCDPHIFDSGFGRGRQPVINVTWEDAQRYVAWLSRMTGKTYRLLSEAEYEYATRAGTQTAYPWGDDIKLDGTAMANCIGCGSQWDTKRLLRSGHFRPTNSASTTWWGMSMSGRRIVSTTITPVRRRMVRPGSKAATVLAVSCAAVRGTAMRTISAPRPVARSPLATGTTILVFGSRGRLSLEPFSFVEDGAAA